MVKYANNEKIACNLANHFPYPYTKSDGVAFIKAAMQRQPVQTFAIEINNEAAGAISLHSQQVSRTQALTGRAMPRNECWKKQALHSNTSWIKWFIKMATLKMKYAMEYAGTTCYNMKISKTF